MNPKNSMEHFKSQPASAILSSKAPFGANSEQTICISDFVCCFLILNSYKTYELPKHYYFKNWETWR